MRQKRISFPCTECYAETFAEIRDCPQRRAKTCHYEPHSATSMKGYYYVLVAVPFIMMTVCMLGLFSPITFFGQIFILILAILVGIVMVLSSQKMTLVHRKTFEKWQCNNLLGSKYLTKFTTSPQPLAVLETVSVNIPSIPFEYIPFMDGYNSQTSRRMVVAVEMVESALIGLALKGHIQILGALVYRVYGESNFDLENPLIVVRRGNVPLSDNQGWLGGASSNHGWLEDLLVARMPDSSSAPIEVFDLVRSLYWTDVPSPSDWLLDGVIQYAKMRGLGIKHTESRFGHNLALFGYKFELNSEHLPLLQAAQFARDSVDLPDIEGFGSIRSLLVPPIFKAIESRTRKRRPSPSAS